jgi:(1->4)-alpha-D-glucan 1-alpha-D-glucosylmutase
MNARVRGATSSAHEYLLYQTLLGTLDPDESGGEAHEAFIERIVQYMRKAAREGKTHTSWTQPDEGYEGAMEHFIREALAPEGPNPFLRDLREVARALNWYGALNSLSLTLLKYSSPGVPDLYQGCELIDHSLVDPDNRRPVDYDKRLRWLGELEAVHSAQELRQLAGSPESGRAKLWLAWRLLCLRKRMPQLFRDGSYEPLEVRGACAGHVVAFLRRDQGRAMVVMAVRLFATLERHRRLGERGLPLGEAAWGDTQVLLPADLRVESLEDVISGARHPGGGAIAVADALRVFPGALLVFEGTGTT